MVVYACNFSSREVDGGEFEASLGYIARPYLKKLETTKKFIGPSG
jgi:hypothetical protein